MLEQVFRYIEEEAMLPAGSRVVVAVSGGADSMALLHALFTLRRRLDWQLGVAHLNHMLRSDEEVAREARLVEQTAAHLGLPCIIDSVDVARFRKERGLGIEEAAREARFRFLAQAARELGADRVALGHHRDDQVETLLMHLLRGTGLRGLTGIPPVRPWQGVTFVRPLLQVSRQEVRDYCGKQEIPYLEDSSNRSLAFTRNRLRLRTVPRLKEINPRFEDSLLRLSEQARMDEEHLQSEVEQQLQKGLVRWQGDQVAVARQAFVTLPAALQSRVVKLILDHLFEGVPYTYTHIRQVMTQAVKGRHCVLPRGWRLDTEGEWLRFRQASAEGSAVPAYAYRLPIPGQVDIEEVGGCFVAAIAEAGEELCDRLTGYSHRLIDWAVFDWSKIDQPLWVRSRQAGDRMRPFGLNGSKKVKDIFIDAKWPRSLRQRTPLLASSTTVLWIPGLRRSEEAPVTEQSARRLVVMYLRRDEKGLDGV